MRLIMSLLGNRVRKSFYSVSTTPVIMLFVNAHVPPNCRRVVTATKRNQHIHATPLHPIGCTLWSCTAHQAYDLHGHCSDGAKDLDKPLMEGMVLGISTITSALISRVWLFSDERFHLQGMGVH